MSSYKTKIDCPYCKKRTEGWALDDYFGPHHYALKCGECFTVWRIADAGSVYAPTTEQRCWREFNQPGGGSDE